MILFFVPLVTSWTENKGTLNKGDGSTSWKPLKFSCLRLVLIWPGKREIGVGNTGLKWFPDGGTASANEFE